MTAHAELEAMAAIAAALEGLEAPARARVLRWAAGHFDMADAVAGVPAAEGSRGGSAGSQQQPEQFDDIYALFEAGTPKTEEDRALLAGYWLQTGEQQASFTSAAANAALRQMGIGASNITRAYAGLIARKPALVQQLSKSGRSKQSRKQYRLTSAGLQAAQQLLADEADG